MALFQLAASNIGWVQQDDARILATMKRVGYTGLEIAPTRVLPQSPYTHLPQAQDFARQMAQEGFSIPSMQSILNGKTENLFDPQGAQALLAHLQSAYAFAQSVHCPSLVFGCPRNRQMPPEGCVQDADPFFVQAAQLAAQAGVVLALEPVPPCYSTNFLNRVQDTFAYVRRLSVPGLTVNFDLGALLTNEEPLSLLENELDLVSHIHISEPGLAPICPRPEHCQLADLLRANGYTGFVSIEMKTTDADTMEAALQYVAEVFA